MTLYMVALCYGRSHFAVFSQILTSPFCKGRALRAPERFSQAAGSARRTARLSPGGRGCAARGMLRLRSSPPPPPPRGRETALLPQHGQRFRSSSGQGRAKKISAEAGKAGSLERRLKWRKQPSRERRVTRKYLAHNTAGKLFYKLQILPRRPVGVFSYGLSRVLYENI